MARIILFNKPYRVLSQFREHEDKLTLANYFDDKSLRIAGRLDYESEGLLILSDDGRLVNRLSEPKFNKRKTYLVQVEGEINPAALEQLRQGIQLKDGVTRVADSGRITEPDWLWPRDPPIRYRASIPTSWIKLTLREGRNRQVRRMTAAVGYPTLRLIRARVADWSLAGLAPGQYREV